MLSTAALGPACRAVALHDWRAVAASAAVQTALLTDSARILISLVRLGPALEVEGRLNVWLFIWWLGDGRLEGIEMGVLQEWIA